MPLRDGTIGNRAACRGGSVPRYSEARRQELYGLKHQTRRAVCGKGRRDRNKYSAGDADVEGRGDVSSPVLPRSGPSEAMVDRLDGPSPRGLLSLCRISKTVNKMNRVSTGGSNKTMKEDTVRVATTR